MPVLTARHALPKIDDNEHVNETNLYALWDAIDAAIPLTSEIQLLAAGVVGSATLDTLADVDAPAPNDGDQIVWRDAGGGAWVAEPGPNLAAYQPLAAKGQANGYASLDAGAKVPAAQLPAIAPAFPLSKDDAVAGDDILRAKRAADAQYRIIVKDDHLLAGPGNAAADVRLHRMTGPALGWAIRNANDSLYRNLALDNLYAATVKDITNASRQFSWVNGSPEGSVTAAVGAIVSDYANGKLYVKETGTGNTGWKELAVVGSGGGPLASKEYSNASAYTTSSATLVDIDATNLALTFTVPASGVVLVRIEMSIEPGTGSTVHLGLRESTSTVKAAGIMHSSVNNHQRRTFTWRVSGLTPGASKTYKFAWASFGSSQTIMVTPNNANPPPAPIVMEVWPG